MPVAKVNCRCATTVLKLAMGRFFDRTLECVLFLDPPDWMMKSTAKILNLIWEMCRVHGEDCSRIDAIILKLGR